MYVCVCVRESAGSLVAVLGKGGMELHPPCSSRLTPVFPCVSVRDSSALHLCPNQSSGLYLPPGPTLSLTKVDTGTKGSRTRTKKVEEISKQDRG